MPAQYLSCKFIEGALAFIQTGIHFCAVVHSGTKGFAWALPSPSDDRLPRQFVDELLAARERIRAENAAGLDNQCKGCHLLTTAAWGERPYLVDYISFHNFNVCNLRCSYCWLMLPSNASVPKYSYRVEGIVYELLDRNLLSPNATISWSGGGEPTMSKEFRPLTRRLLDLGCTFIVDTNATLYSALVEEGLRENRMRVIISVDAGTRETYKIVKAKDKFDLVWEHIKRYVAAAADKSMVVVKYIQTADNARLEEIEAFIRKAQDAGVMHVGTVPDLYAVKRGDLSAASIMASAFLIHLATKNGFHVDANGGVRKDFFGKYGDRVERLVTIMNREIGLRGPLWSDRVVAVP